MSTPPLRLSGTRDFDAAHDAVFEALFDPMAQLDWNSLYLILVVEPPGRPRNGTIVRGTFRGAGRATMTFAEVVEGKSFVHWSRLLMFERIDLGDFQHRFDVAADGGATRVTQTVSVELTRLGRLLSPLLRSSFTKRLPESFDELGAYLARS